jgi:hypothetical protein
MPHHPFSSSTHIITLCSLQGVLNERRRDLIEIVFNKLDKDGSGIITTDDICETYDTSRHPDVISGRRTPHAVLADFLNNFDVGGNRDGMVAIFIQR